MFSLCAKAATVALGAILVKAQETDRALCGPAGIISDDCESALKLVDTGKTYVTDDDPIAYCGNCGIYARKNNVINEGALTGQRVYDDVRKVLDACQGSGFYVDSSGGPGQNVNVSASAYEVCMYGVCGKPSGCNTISKRGVNVDEPAPGVKCSSGPGVQVNSIIDAANSIPEGTVILPASFGGLIFVHEYQRSQGIDGNDLKGSAINSANLCSNEGIVGGIVDSAHENYVIEMGLQCGKNGQGFAGCGQGASG